MIWNAQDVARDAVRRQGSGMSVEQVEAAVAEATVREEETRQELHAPSPAGGGGLRLVAEDPQRLAQVWEARHAEWRRVQEWMASRGAALYEPELDGVGSGWAAEREQRRASALRAHADWSERRREERDQVQAELWLSAGAGRVVRAAAGQAGITVHEALAQLAERVVLGEDGTVSVAPFTPSR